MNYFKTLSFLEISNKILAVLTTWLEEIFKYVFGTKIFVAFLVST